MEEKFSFEDDSEWSKVLNSQIIYTDEEKKALNNLFKK